MKNMQQAKSVLWHRIQRLMIDRWGSENLSRLAREAGVGVATISRIKAADTSVGLDVLEKIGKALGVSAWQLLAPEGDNLPAPSSFSPLALDLARILDQITDPEQHRRAYAVASQVLSFGVDLVALSPSPEPSQDHSPAE